MIRIAIALAALFVGSNVAWGAETKPVIRYIPAVYVFTMGSSISTISPTNTGGTVSTWSVIPALPAGLSFDTATGQISGTPTVVSLPTAYTVKGTNTRGSATTGLLITVKDLPPIIGYNPSTYIFTKGTAIPTIQPTSSGGRVLLFSVLPKLPAGLAFNIFNGQITGTPTALSSTRTYTIEALNLSGVSKTTVTITVESLVLPPVIAYNPSTYTLTRGVAVGPIIPTSSGGAITAYNVSPALPGGLSLSPATGVISGTPTAVTATATYTVMATATGGSTTASLKITVNDIPPADLIYKPNPLVCTKGSQIQPCIPFSSTGGNIVSYSVSPSLPEGLSLDTASGAITGTPTVATLGGSTPVYTIFAYNSGGSTSVAITIMVKEIAPTILVYPQNPATYARGSTITPNVPTCSGGPVHTYSVSPALPEGLVLAASTNGAITGTPTAIAPTATYTVTATNTGGSTSVQLVITVTDTPPAYLTYSQNPAVYTKGMPIAANTPSSSGGGVTSYSVGPALPAGLGLDTGTGVLRGTPTAIATTTNYTVTATNSGGSTTTVLTLTINDLPPANLKYMPDSLICTKDSPIQPCVPFSSTGGTIVSYSVSPALPEGLSLDTTTGAITGAPTVATVGGSIPVYTVFAHNSGGTTSVGIPILVKEIPPTNLIYPLNPATCALGSAITPNIPTSSGGTVHTYSVSPALPSGLVLATSTNGAITGTPTAITPTATYTVTATNTGGSSTVALVITITDLPPANLTYSENPAVYTKGMPIAANTPSSSGGAVTSYSVSPTLPEGLSLDPSNGVISGTPTVVIPGDSYTVTALNSGGSATTTLTIAVAAAQPPPVISSFTATPATITVEMGTTLSWSVSWARTLSLDNGIGDVSGMTSKNVAPVTTTTYTLTATNEAGASVTAQTTVNVVLVPPPPIIGTQPADRAVGLKSCATFNVSASSIGTLSYQWQKNGIAIPGATSSSYTTPPATLADSGALFNVIVNDAFSQSLTSSNATLTVLPGLFGGTGTLAVGRGGQTATLLPSGKVLITGGDTHDLPSAELYDPATRSSTATGSMHHPRAWHTATLLPNGQVLVVGGDNLQPATAEVYDPATGLFTTTVGTLHQRRTGHTATLLPNGKVLLAGGDTLSYLSAELYDPATGLFSVTGGGTDIPLSRTYHTATLLANGDVLLAGGWGEPHQPRNKAVVYSSSMGRFGVINPGVEHIDMMASRAFHTATMLPNGKVLLAGGRDAANNALASAELYDPSLGVISLIMYGQCTPAGSLTTGRTGHGALLLPSGLVLFSGGQDSSGVLSSAEVYDPATSIATAVGTMSAARVSHTSTLLEDGKVLITGGANSSGSLASAELFDPQNGLTAPAPDASILAPAFATDGQTGLCAVVEEQPGCSYFWMSTEGTITSGHGTPSIVFTAGPSGTTTLDALVVSGLGIPSQGTAMVRSSGVLPVISAFSPGYPAVEVGKGTTLNWATNGATSLRIDPDIGDVTGLTTVTITPATTTTYTLTASNVVGASVTAHTTVQVIQTPAVPIIAVFSATPATINAGMGTTLIWHVFGATSLSIDHGLGDMTSLTSRSIAPTETTTYTLIASNASGAITTATVTVTVVSVAIASFSATPSTITAGATSTLSWTVNGAISLSLDQRVGDVTGLTSVTVAPIAPTTYTLTATDASGQSVTAQVTVGGVSPPEITSFSAASPTITAGMGTTLNWTVRGAVSLNIDQGVGDVSGLSSRNVAPTVTTTYTLTAANEAGSSATTQTTVTVLPLPPEPPVITLQPLDQVAGIGGTATFSVSASGTGVLTYLWQRNGTAIPAATSTSYTASSVALVDNGTLFSVVVSDAFGHHVTSSSASLTVSSGVFTDASSMNTMRNGQTATLLPDGRVLIAGGDHLSAASAEIYDPSTGRSMPTGSMHNPRVWHTATLLPNGNVLVAGGDGLQPASAEIYDPATGLFTATAGIMHQRRTGHTATLLPNGQVFLAGGDALPYLSAELYDPATGLFVETGRGLHQSRTHHTATLLISGLVLLAGGLGENDQPRSTAILYDFSLGTYLTPDGLAEIAMSNSRAFHTATPLPNGEVLLAGGMGAAHNSLASTEPCDPTGQFRVGGTLTVARAGHGATLLPNGQVLFSGGSDSGSVLTSAELYEHEPTTELTTAVSPMATPRSFHTSTLLMDGKVLITGGGNSSGSLASTELFDPQNGLTAPAPDASILAPAFATGGQTGLCAAVEEQPGCSYFWMSTEGTITSGHGTPSIVFTAGPSGTTTLDALVVSGLGIPSQGTAVVRSSGVLPVISAFSAAHPIIETGTGTTLDWTVSGATTLSLDHGIGEVTGLTSLPVAPTETTTYTLTATNAAGASVIAHTTVTVVPTPSTPYVLSFVAVPPTIQSGTGTVLTWRVFGATSLSIDHGIGDVTNLTSRSIAPTETTTYTLTATNASGATTAAQVTVTVVSVAITSFSATPSTITAGATCTLSWTVSGASSLSLDQRVGDVTGLTSVTVAPTAPTTYTLIATDASGQSVTAQVTVEVVSPREI